MDNTNCRFRSTVLAILSIIAATVVATTGCYLDYPEHGGSAEVQGTITLDGMPVNNAKIVFLPDKLKRSSSKVAPIAYGQTDSEGKFTLAYRDGEKEIAAGVYKLIISKSEHVVKDGSRLNLEEDDATLLRNSKSLTTDGSEAVETIERIPTMYNSESTLKFTIEPSPKILFPKFDLTTVDPFLSE